MCISGATKPLFTSRFVDGIENWGYKTASQTLQQHDHCLSKQIQALAWTESTRNLLSYAREWPLLKRPAHCLSRLLDWVQDLYSWRGKRPWGWALPEARPMGISGGAQAEEAAQSMDRAGLRAVPCGRPWGVDS